MTNLERLGLHHYRIKVLATPKPVEVELDIYAISEDHAKSGILSALTGKSQAKDSIWFEYDSLIKESRRVYPLCQFKDGENSCDIEVYEIGDKFCYKHSGGDDV